jgi:holo-[acyl-carrier protein] synthase
LKAIGVDIVETTRIEAMISRYGNRFLNRVFTPQEQVYCQGRIPSLAARWAAKEAMSKAFGTGIGEIAFKDIEVCNNARGRPEIILHGPARQMAQSLGFTRVALSLSHTKACAVAFVVAE